MKVLAIFLCLLCASCLSTPTSPPAETWTFPSFQEIPLGDLSILEKKWGKTSTQTMTTIGDRTFLRLEYIGKNDRTVADFIVDPETKAIVEKTFFMMDDRRIEPFLKQNFPEISFEKTRLPCAHWNESILFNAERGLFVMTSGRHESKIDGVSYSVPAVFKQRMREGLDPNLTCPPKKRASRSS